MNQHGLLHHSVFLQAIQIDFGSPPLLFTTLTGKALAAGSERIQNPQPATPSSQVSIRIVVSGVSDWGRISAAGLFHGRATVGFTPKGWGGFTGYDYFRISDSDTHS